MALNFAVVGALAFAAGCNRPKLVAEDVSLGTICFNKAGASTEGEFRIPSDPTNCNLAFEIHGFSDSNDIYIREFQSAFHELGTGRLRLKLQLYEKGSADEFYRADFPLGTRDEVRRWGTDALAANYADLGDRRRARLVLLLGVQPIGSSSFDFEGDASVTYLYRANSTPLKCGKLVPRKDYRAKLTVVNPISLTNEIEFRLYSVYRKSERTAPGN